HVAQVGAERERADGASGDEGRIDLDRNAGRFRIDHVQLEHVAAVLGRDVNDRRGWRGAGAAGPATATTAAPAATTAPTAPATPAPAGVRGAAAPAAVAGGEESADQGDQQPPGPAVHCAHGSAPLMSVPEEEIGNRGKNGSQR